MIWTILRLLDEIRGTYRRFLVIKNIVLARFDRAFYFSQAVAYPLLMNGTTLIVRANNKAVYYKRTK
jgi:hypothetical protein